MYQQEGKRENNIYMYGVYVYRAICFPTTEECPGMSCCYFHLRLRRRPSGSSSPSVQDRSKDTDCPVYARHGYFSLGGIYLVSLTIMSRLWYCIPSLTTALHRCVARLRCTTTSPCTRQDCVRERGRRSGRSFRREVLG